MVKYQPIVDELSNSTDEVIHCNQVRKMVKTMCEIRGMKYTKMDKNIARMILNRYLETGEFNFNKPHMDKPIEVFCKKKLNRKIDKRKVE
jgi:hypothetical protein